MFPASRPKSINWHNPAHCAIKSHSIGTDLDSLRFPLQLDNLILLIRLPIYDVVSRGLLKYMNSNNFNNEDAQLFKFNDGTGLFAVMLRFRSIPPESWLCPRSSSRCQGSRDCRWSRSSCRLFPAYFFSCPSRMKTCSPAKASVPSSRMPTQKSVKSRTAAIPVQEDTSGAGYPLKPADTTVPSFFSPRA